MISNNQKKWIYKYKDGDYPIVNVFVKNNTNNLLLSNSSINKGETICNGGIIYLFNQTDVSWIYCMHYLKIKYACIWLNGTLPKNANFNNLLMDDIESLNKVPTGWLCSGEFEFVDSIPAFKEKMVLLNISQWLKIRVSPVFDDTMYIPGYQLKKNLLGRQYLIGSDSGKNTQTPPKLKKKYYGSKWINSYLKIGKRYLTYEFSNDLTNHLINEEENL